MRNDCQGPRDGRAMSLDDGSWAKKVVSKSGFTRIFLEH